MSTSYCLPLNFNPCPFLSSKTLQFPILKRYDQYLSRIRGVRSSLSSNYEREEARWLREEQRWLREEQRWLREEQRWLREESTWHAHRDSLIAENFALKIQIQRGSVPKEIERVEKSVQASLRAPEDGIMTVEHQLEYSTIEPKEDPKLTVVLPKEGANGVAFVSVTGISQIQPTIVKDKDDTEIDVTQHRVFLLGENRWEEPSRLLDRNKSTTNCVSCRGEGRMICSECDGSGEPNIEPQFLEWGDEEMKCPYCKGIGFATCDVCDGKGEAVFRI